MMKEEADSNDQALGDSNCLSPEVLKQRLHKTARHELDEQLVENECAVAVIEGVSAQAMIITSRHRVLVFKKGMMGGVTFGRKMYAWDFNEIHGVRVDVRLMNGFVALKTTDSDPDRMSYWGLGGGNAWEAANAIPVGKPTQEQAREGAAVLRRLLYRYHNLRENSSAHDQLIAPPQPMSFQPAAVNSPVTSVEPSASEPNRFCFACGTQLRTGSVFCSSCGQQLR